MKFLSTLLTLGGYILVYAAVANKGKLYANPWMGVFRDAYGVDSVPTPYNKNSPGPSAPATRRRMPQTGAGGPTGSTARPTGRGTTSAQGTL